MYLLPLCVLLIVGIPGIKSAKPEASCDVLLKRADKCLLNAVMGGLSPDTIAEGILVKGGEKFNIVPQNDEDMQRHCKRISADIRCIRNYNKCLKLLPKTIFGIVLRNIRQLMQKDVCGTLAGRQEFVKHIKCFTPQNVKVLHQVVNEVTVVMDYLATNVTQNMIIPWGCCAYFFVFEAGRDKIEDLCLNRVGPGAGHYILGLVSTVATDAIDVGCGRFSSVLSCDVHLKEAMRVYRDLIYPPEKLYNLPLASSPVLPILEISRRLDSLEPEDDSKYPSGRS